MLRYSTVRYGMDPRAQRMARCTAVGRRPWTLAKARAKQRQAHDYPTQCRMNAKLPGLVHKLNPAGHTVPSTGENEETYTRVEGLHDVQFQWPLTQAHV